jgi:inner membrane transporter RhtA
VVPPYLYFVVSAVFHYLGPAFAVLLFERVDVLGVAWLRIASAALVFAVWRRPWRAVRSLDQDGRRLLVRWGAVLALMNCCFYLAIDRLPLGTVAAIEFLPVIALAALAARTGRNLLALAAAAGGVYLLTDVRLVAEPLGFAFAAANARQPPPTSSTMIGPPLRLAFSRLTRASNFRWSFGFVRPITSLPPF